MTILGLRFLTHTQISSAYDFSESWQTMWTLNIFEWHQMPIRCFRSLWVILHHIMQWRWGQADERHLRGRAAIFPSAETLGVPCESPRNTSQRSQAYFESCFRSTGSNLNHGRCLRLTQVQWPMVSHGMIVSHPSERWWKSTIGSYSDLGFPIVS